LEQVAQLWQRDNAILALFFLQNHEITFLRHPVGASGEMQVLYAKVLMQRNFVAEFYRENISYIRKTAKYCF